MTDWVYVLGILFILIGVALVIFEVLHPGAFLLVPGTVLIVAGILFLFFPDLVTQTYWGATILVIVAVAAGIATIPIYQRIAPIHRPMTTIPTSITGETGLVVAPVTTDSISGKVRIGSEVWSARSKVPIVTGTRVRVVGAGLVCDVRSTSSSRFQWPSSRRTRFRLALSRSRVPISRRPRHSEVRRT